MPGLELKKNNDVFTIEPTGSVSLNNAPAGKWTTDKSNKIIITKNDQSKIEFDVVWEFDSNNQLVVSSGTNKFNFHEVAGNVPNYDMKEAVLIVSPIKNKNFSFEIRGDWSLDEKHDLSITVNGKKSVIDGFIHDPQSKFTFHFSNKKNLLQGYVLGFVGAWSEFIDEAGKPRLKFTYKRAGQADGEFVLPKSVVIDKLNNQLVYEYDKQSKKRSIQLVGTLFINDDFTINYKLDRQVSNGKEAVAGTTFNFSTVFKKRNFSGDLELSIKKDDGTAGTTLTIGGKFTAVLGPAKLKAGFTFEQNRAGNRSVSTFGFAGELEFSNGKIQWTFNTDNTVTKTIVLAINVDINIMDDVQLDARLNLKMEDGKLRGITFFLGIGF